MLSNEMSVCERIEYGESLINKITYLAQREILIKAFEYINKNGA